MTLAGSSKPTAQTQRIHAPVHPFFRDVVKRFLAMLFLAAFFVPGVGAWRRWHPAGKSHENRRLATRPTLPRNFKEAELYSDRWLNFYRDHFGFRNTLIRGVALTRFHGLGADTDGRVLVGRDGWLFLRPDGDQNFIAFRGLNPFSDDELNAWQHVLEQRAAWLAARGIPCLFVIPPNKETVYPEYLPDEVLSIRPRHRGSISLWSISGRRIRRFICWIFARRYLRRNLRAGCISKRIRTGMIWGRMWRIARSWIL